MKKLWQKESSTITSSMEAFTIGRDIEFDLLLAPYDVKGSIAHVAMLQEVGLMASNEAELVIKELQIIADEIAHNTFTIREGVEDVHSQIEILLTERIGSIGKKIHSGRSRNDQVAVDIKLYLKNVCLELKDKVVALFHLLQQKSNDNQAKIIPGYTHLQVAMPSSIGLWLGAYAEALIDDLNLLATAFDICNKNPLGSGAGYGSSFPLNRKKTTELLGFNTLHWNSIYAQMSRGKTEKFLSVAMASIAGTIARLAMDACLFASSNFRFIAFPDELTTGSSIMPHKKNPDVLELVRGKCNRLQSIPNELQIMLTNLPSGYHRELQLTKEIIFPAVEELYNCIDMTLLMFSNCDFPEVDFHKDIYKYMYSVEAVNQLVNDGIPFRDAYLSISSRIEEGVFDPPKNNELSYTHEGSIGNLANEEIAQELKKVVDKFR